MNDITQVAGTKNVGDWKALRPRLMKSLDGAASDAWSEAWSFLRERVETRYLAPIRAVRDIRARRGEGFTVAALHCMLIEFLESCWQGKVYKHEDPGPDEYSTSASLFKSFLTTHPPFKNAFNKTRAGEFFSDVRCGLLHETATKGKWLIKSAHRQDSSKILDFSDGKRELYRDGLDSAMRTFLEDFERVVVERGDRERRVALFRRFDDLCGIRRVYHFAYGRNLLAEELAKRGVFAHTARRARLPNYKLVFNKLGKDGTAKASLVAEPGREVWGVCYELEQDGLDRLRRKEGDGYVAIGVPISAADPGDEGSASFSATAFVAKENAVGGEAPSPEYRDAVLEGMRGRDLPSAYIEQAARTMSRSAPAIAALPRMFAVSARFESPDDTVAALRSLLQAFAEGHVPGPGYDREALRQFCVSATDGQREAFANLRAGSWAVVNSTASLPSEVRVAEVFVPTMVVAAIMSRFRQMFPGDAAAIPGFDDSLRRGMDFAALRQLAGHGIGALHGMCEAVGILSLGGVPELLRGDTKLSPSLWTSMRQAKEQLLAALPASKPGRGNWDVPPRELLDDALSLLTAVADA